MAKKFDAPLRFLSESERGTKKVWYDQGNNTIHLVNDEEHQTLHCASNVILDEVTLCVGMMQPQSFDEAYDTLRLFQKMSGGCLMGDLKPGLKWEWTEEEDYYDPWKDRVSWDKWISEEYIAQEYYAREQYRRQKYGR